MTRQMQMDVMVEVDKEALGKLGAIGASRFVLEKLREGAEKEAAQVGGHVITDRRPEIQVAEGQSLQFGDEVMLLAARFWVEVPESFDFRSRNHVGRVNAFGTVV